MRFANRREGLAWAAGLFEGEGCCHGHGGAVTMSLSMTDEDRVEELREVLGLGTIRPYPSRSANWKPGWKWSTYNFEASQAVAAMLWPWLGPRRKAAITKALLTARALPPTRRKRVSCACGFASLAGPLAMHRKACLVAQGA